ncbi:hypothetical protein ACWGLF_42920 [Streptomyces puniciscabiei]
MTAIYYDTEFIDTGSSIDLISIGLVAENAEELYCVVADDELMNRVIRDEWLRRHVMSSLPVAINYSLPANSPDGTTNPAWSWDLDHPDWDCVLPRSVIADQVKQFIKAFPDPQLWAWCGARDHVVMCWLWGQMAEQPTGIPNWTNDLRQEMRRLGDPRMPEQPKGEHNALEDARFNLVRAQHLAELAREESRNG